MTSLEPTGPRDVIQANSQPACQAGRRTAGVPQVDRGGFWQPWSSSAAGATTRNGARPIAPPAATYDRCKPSAHDLDTHRERPGAPTAGRTLLAPVTSEIGDRDHPLRTTDQRARLLGPIAARALSDVDADVIRREEHCGGALGVDVQVETFPAELQTFDAHGSEGGWPHRAHGEGAVGRVGLQA